MVKAQILILLVVTAFAQYSEDEAVPYGMDMDFSFFSPAEEASFPSYDPLANYFQYGSDEDDGYANGTDDENYGHEGNRQTTSPSYEPYTYADFDWMGEGYEEDPGMTGGSTAVDASGDPEEPRSIASVEDPEKKDEPAPPRDLTQECLNRGFSIESCCKTCVENYIAAWARGECEDIHGDCREKAEQNASEAGSGEGSL